MNKTVSPQTTIDISTPDSLTLLAYLFIVIFAGANAVAVRFTVAELPPFWGAVLRFASAALIFWAIALIRRASIPTGRALFGILLYGFLSFGASYAFLYWGLQEIPAGMTQVILALVPLMTFFSAFFHGLESFRWRGLFGATLAVVGIALTFFQQPAGALPFVSLLAIVAGAACIAESTVVVKMYPQSDPFMTNALAMTVGALTLVILSLVAGEAWTWPTRSATWASILYLVFIGSVVVFYLFLFIVRRWTASATSYQFVLFPFVTVLLAAWLADETINSALLLGGALVLAGVWIGAFSGSSMQRKAQ
jgi:drug/metabolite transporter (DMT)-like permease